MSLKVSESVGSCCSADTVTIVHQDNRSIAIPVDIVHVGSDDVADPL